MTGLAPALERAAQWLQPHRQELLESWIRAVTEVRGIAQAEAAARCSSGLETLLSRLASGDLEGYLQQAMVSAEHEARRGTSLLGVAVETRMLNRCLGTVLTRVCPDPQTLTQSLVAFDELGDRRLEILLAAQEAESARRLVQTQEQAARVVEQARGLRRANEALRRAEAQSRHRAEQLGLLSSVSHRIAPIREPEELMQQAADQIRTRMNHTYVAVVVLEEDGALVGRWAGRPGLDRVSSGRALGPPGGIIGRAIRQRAPQVVGDVTRDPDYHPDVQGTRSELAVPLLEGGRALGALDFQSEHPFAFGLEDVAAAETLGEFLVVALRNARLFQEARRRGGAGAA
ncbi:MAG TPA: GAF domain-containing protein [Vicinamibacteria bacterium]|nr:GAF domain-containing protein [Vicinamibacteria bacterium]